MLEGFRGEDWEWRHLGGNGRGGKANRFAYLGNGFSTREMEGGDQTWYLDRVDELF